MSGANWSRLGGKRFDFSSIKQEYIIAAVLGVVILGSGYLMVRQFMGPGEGTGPTGLHYKCEKCGNEFVVEIDKLPPVRSPGEEQKVLKLDCPKCKAQSSAWREMECPKCHKYFVADSLKDRFTALGRGGRGGMGGQSRDVCPFCKTDVNEWHRAHSQD